MADILVICVLFFCIAAGATMIIRALSLPVQQSPPTPPAPATARGAEANRINEIESRAYLYPDGREVFLPPPPHPSPVYEITFTGILRKQSGKAADAFYKADDNGNFSHGTDWLRINGRQLSDWEPVASDRCEHRYTVRIDGPRERLTLALHAGYCYGFTGSLTAVVAVLPAGTPTIAERRRQDQAAKEAEKKAARFAEAFAAEIKALSIRAQLHQNWGDERYRKRFAEAYTTDLIKRQDEIRMEAAGLLEQQHLLSYLRRHNPDVVQVLLGRLDALHRAERVLLDRAMAAAKPKSAPQEPPAPERKKLTAADVQQMKVRRQQIQLGDKLALAKDRVATIEDVKAYVKAQYAHLDEDEQARITQQILDQVDEDENQHGKTL